MLPVVHYYNLLDVFLLLLSNDKSNNYTQQEIIIFQVYFHMTIVKHKEIFSRALLIDSAWSQPLNKDIVSIRVVTSHQILQFDTL